MSYGKYTELEINRYKEEIDFKIKNATNEKLIYNDKYEINIYSYDLVCKEESFNFGIDIYIETTVNMRYEIFDKSNNLILRSNLRISDEDCYGVGYSHNPFDNSLTIKEAILRELDYVDISDNLDEGEV